MRIFTSKVTKDAGEVTLTLSLPIDMRIKSRATAVLPSGESVGWQLERGQIIRAGDILKSDDGVLLQITAAPETLSVARADHFLLLQAAYHLGNRHVAVELGDGWLAYRHDHVLDAMLAHFGIAVTCEERGFEPESGAYAQLGAHSHAH